MTAIYTEALKHAKSGETSRWSEARAIRLALKNGGTIREYAFLRDKNWKSEQRYSNWVVAAEFVDTFKHDFEGELSQLHDAGLNFITYYAEIGRWWRAGATPDECFELLNDCVTSDGLRGVDWLRAKINEVVEPAPDWNKRLKKLNTAIYEILYGGSLDADEIPHGLFALLRSIEGMLKPLIGKVAK